MVPSYFCTYPFRLSLFLRLAKSVLMFLVHKREREEDCEVVHTQGNAWFQYVLFNLLFTTEFPVAR